MARRYFDSSDELIDWLTAAGIDVTGWGEGDSKTPADLWREYVVGESYFFDDPPRRLVEVAQLLIRRGDMVLIEIEQEFADGRRRSRLRLPSEKVMRGEEPITAAVRCLQEELGFGPGDVMMKIGDEFIQMTADSPSYPGLPTRYEFFTFEIIRDSLPDGDFYHENTAPGDPIRRHLWGWRKKRPETGD